MQYQRFFEGSGSFSMTALPLQQQQQRRRRRLFLLQLSQ
jgi:hypothetical protein